MLSEVREKTILPLNLHFIGLHCGEKKNHYTVAIYSAMSLDLQCFTDAY